MRKPAPLRCAGLHNLLPVIRRLYFNKLTKLNIQFLNNELIILENSKIYVQGKGYVVFTLHKFSTKNI